MEVFPGQDYRVAVGAADPKRMLLLELLLPSAVDHLELKVPAVKLVEEVCLNQDHPVALGMTHPKGVVEDVCPNRDHPVARCMPPPLVVGEVCLNQDHPVALCMPHPKGMLLLLELLVFSPAGYP